MKVCVENDTEQQRWWVCIDDCRVSFRTAAEAEQFAERLTTRLNAPHSLDMLAAAQPLRAAKHTDLRCTTRL